MPASSTSPGTATPPSTPTSSVAVVDRRPRRPGAVALPPFRRPSPQGVPAVMAGHLLVPAVDELPASLSRRWLTDILRGEMGFDRRGGHRRAGDGGHRRHLRHRRAAPCWRCAPAPTCCAWAARTPVSRCSTTSRDAIVAAVRRGDLDIDRLPRRREHGCARWPARPSLPGGRTTVTDAATRAGRRRTGDRRAAARRSSHPDAWCCAATRPTNLAVGTIPWGLAAAGRRTPCDRDRRPSR